MFHNPASASHGAQSYRSRYYASATYQRAQARERLAARLRLAGFALAACVALGVGAVSGAAYLHGLADAGARIASASAPFAIR